MAKKKATTRKTAKRTTTKRSTGGDAKPATTKRAGSSKAKSPAAKAPRADSSTTKAVKAAKSTARPTRGKPSRDKHSTLEAAGAGEAASFTPEPKPAVRKHARAGAKAREGAKARDGRMSSATPPEALPKTRLNEKQLTQFRELLLEKRSELLSDVRMLTKDALGKSRKDSTGDLSSMPIHMADIGSDNWEQDFTLGLIANERQLVREIDEALQRIEDRTYGMCLATHKPITVARLRAKPWAKYCIEYAQQLERRGY